MRKILSLIHMTLDGFAAGPNGEMDWIVYNDEVERESHELHARMDAAIYGRVTYDIMQSYWPSVLADPATHASPEGAHARWYDNATKFVFSRTLDHVSPRNTVLLKDNVVEEMRRIKQQPGKDIWLLGSPSIAQLLARHNLIDEFRLNISPVILGRGKSYFANVDAMTSLNLLESRTLKGGVVALRYQNGLKGI